jgi:hypothetical protein
MTAGLTAPMQANLARLSLGWVALLAALGISRNNDDPEHVSGTLR